MTMASFRPLLRVEQEFERHPFRSLPLTLAKRVSLFLQPFQVDGLEGLVELIGAYPLSYLSVSVFLKSTQGVPQLLFAPQLLRLLRAEVGFRLDVTLKGDFRKDVVDIFFGASAVEALAVTVSSLSLERAERLVNNLGSARNTASFVRIAVAEDIGDREDLSAIASRVADMVAVGHSLMSLDLKNGNFRLGYQRFVSCGLVQALQRTQSLCYLRLRNTGLDAKGVVLLSTVMATQNTIELLDVGENQIGNKGVIALAKCLESNNTLRVLFFGTVGATTEGGIHLANSLRRNSRLQVLIMKDDSLGPQSGKTFASMLKLNSSLSCLVLDYCDLGSRGCRSFLSSIQLNRTLKVLRLNYNGATLQDRVDFVHEAQGNGVIERIELADLNILEKKNAISTRRRCDAKVAYSAFGTSYAWHLGARSLGIDFV